MDLHIRTTIRKDYSFIETAALRIGNDVLEVSGWGEYILNGVESADLPYQLDGGYRVEHVEDVMKPNVHFFYVHLDQNKTILIQTFKDLVSVKLDAATAKHFGESAGLMGQFGSGAMLARDGETVVEDPIVFGQEWQVSDTDAKLFQDARFPQFPAQCAMPPTSTRQARRLGESLARQAAQQACSKWGDRAELCVMDVLATGEIALADAGVF